MRTNALNESEQGVIMTDLRKAAEMALEALAWEEIEDAKEHLRQALAQPEQKIMDCVYPKCETAGGCNGPCSKPLYTAPKKREWVGLTEEELDEAMEYWSDDSRSTYGGAIIADGEYVNMRDTWRYIEAKLKEKNT